MPIAMGKQVQGLMRNGNTLFEIKASCLLPFAHMYGGEPQSWFGPLLAVEVMGTGHIIDGAPTGYVGELCVRDERMRGIKNRF